MNDNPGRGGDGLARRLEKLEDDVRAMGSEPAGSPAGRSLERHLERIEGRLKPLELDVETLAEWRAEVRGALTLVRVLVGASVLEAVVAVLFLLDVVRGGGV